MIWWIVLEKIFSKNGGGNKSSLIMLMLEKEYIILNVMKNT